MSGVEVEAWTAELESLFARGLQRLLNSSSWDPDPVCDGLRAYVAERLGERGGVLADTGFVKKGTASAGVARQYTATSGKVDSLQIGVVAAYASAKGWELYLPKCWTSDAARCAAKIPAQRAFAAKN